MDRFVADRVPASLPLCCAVLCCARLQNCAAACFGDDCDAATLNILLPELAISIDGLVVDLIDRSNIGPSRGAAGTAGAAADGSRGRRPSNPSQPFDPSQQPPPPQQSAREGGAGPSTPPIFALSWSEPSPAARATGLLGTLVLTLEQPILFHLVAEAAKLTLHARGALAFLERLIGQRTLVRIEAYVDLTKLTLSLHCREEGIFLSISTLEMELARDGPVRCTSAEASFVEWLVRAIPKRLVEWIKKALQHNLRKEQLIRPWQTSEHDIGALDGILRKVEWLEGLKKEAARRHGESHGRTFV